MNDNKQFRGIDDDPLANLGGEDTFNADESVKIEPSDAKQSSTPDSDTAVLEQAVQDDTTNEPQLIGSNETAHDTSKKPSKSSKTPWLKKMFKPHDKQEQTPKQLYVANAVDTVHDVNDDQSKIPPSKPKKVKQHLFKHQASKHQASSIKPVQPTKNNPTAVNEVVAADYEVQKPPVQSGINEILTWNKPIVLDDIDEFLENSTAVDLSLSSTSEIFGGLSKFITLNSIKSLINPLITKPYLNREAFKIIHPDDLLVAQCDQAVSELLTLLMHKDQVWNDETQMLFIINFALTILYHQDATVWTVILPFYNLGLNQTVLWREFSISKSDLDQLLDNNSVNWTDFKTYLAFVFEIIQPSLNDQSLTIQPLEVLKNDISLNNDQILIAKNTVVPVNYFYHFQPVNDDVINNPIFQFTIKCGEKTVLTQNVNGTNVIPVQCANNQNQLIFPFFKIGVNKNVLDEDDLKYLQDKVDHFSTDSQWHLTYNIKHLALENNHPTKKVLAHPFFINDLTAPLDESISILNLLHAPNTVLECYNKVMKDLLTLNETLNSDVINTLINNLKRNHDDFVAWICAIDLQFLLVQTAWYKSNNLPLPTYLFASSAINTPHVERVKTNKPTILTFKEAWKKFVKGA